AVVELAARAVTHRRDPGRSRAAAVGGGEPLSRRVRRNAAADAGGPAAARSGDGGEGRGAAREDLGGAARPRALRFSRAARGGAGPGGAGAVRAVLGAR